jgi:hypothetical protein
VKVDGVEDQKNAQKQQENSGVEKRGMGENGDEEDEFDPWATVKKYY